MQTDAGFDNETEIARLRRVIEDNERHIARLEHSLDVQIKLNIELADQLIEIRGEHNGEDSATHNTPN